MRMHSGPFALISDMFRRSLFFRYVFSGGSAAAIDIGLLYALTTYLKIYYLAAASFAMTVSFLIRFLLQKYVTFKDDNNHIKKQFISYSLLYAMSLFATNVLLYLLVEKFGLSVLPAQIFSILSIASASFFVYKLLIFKSPHNTKTT